MTYRLLIPGFLIVIMLLLSACGNEEEQVKANEIFVSASSEVQELYKQNCLSCHGSELEGRVGPSSNLQQVGARMSLDEIADKIMNGGGGMRAFKGELSEAEIHQLAEWLVTLK